MARRINTKFLAIAVTVVGGLAGAAYVVPKYVIRESPKRYAEQGQMLMAEKQFGPAVEAFAKAARLDPSNPEMQLNLGKAMYSASGADPELVMGARRAWENALQIDPNYVPALRALLAWYQDRLRFAPSPENFRYVRELAERIIKLDPSDVQTEGLMHMSTIQAWIANIVTDDARIDDSIKSLEALRLKQPANSQFPLYIAQAKIHRVKEYARTPDRANEAAALLQEASTTFDEALKSTERNPGMYFAAATSLQQMVPLADIPSVKKALQDKANEYLETAKNTAQPSDEQYGEILRVWANNIVQQGNPAEAEKVLQELRNQRPNDLNIRFALVRVLVNDPTRWEEAIDILAAPVQETKGEGLQAYVLRTHQEVMVQLELLNLRMNLYALGRKSETERAALRKQIDEDFDKLWKKEGDDVRYAGEIQKLRGRIQMLQGDYVAAIGTFSKALTEIENRTRQRDLQLINYLAICYTSANQTGEAKRLLQELVERNPGFTDGRKRLIRLLLSEHDVPEARKHIDYLEKNAPNDPDVVLLNIATLEREKDKAKIKTIYNSLGEDSRPARYRKAVVAQSTGELDDAVRLLKDVLKEDAGDANAALMLARVYLMQNNRDDAIAAVDAALKAKPNDLTLVRARQKLVAGGDPADDAAERLQAIDQIADPFDRAMARAGEAQARNDIDQLIVHLKEADAARPTDKRPKEQMFQVYLAQKKFAEAEALLKPLSDMNADQCGGRLYRFRLALQRGERQEAREIAQNLARELPEFSSVWTAFGQALQASGQYEEAIQRYIIAISKQANNLDAYRQIIVCNYLLKRPAEALQFLVKARSLFPEDTALRDQEVAHYQRFGEAAKAVPMREQQLAQRSDVLNNWLQLGSAYYLAAKNKLAVNDQKASNEFVEKAVKTLTEARTKWPTDYTLNASLCELHELTGKRDEALAVAKKLAEEPTMQDKAEPLMLLADIHLRANKPVEAESALRQAMGRDRNNVNVPMKLADLLVAMQKGDEALRVLQPHQADLRVLLKRYEVMITMGRASEATTELTELVKQRPNDVTLLNTLGEAHRVQGQYDEAQKRFDEVLKIDPGNIMGLYKTGLVAMQRPKPNHDRAMEVLTQIRDADSDRIPAALSAETRVLLSQVHRSRGDMNSAISEMESAQQFAHENRTVRYNLIDLYMNARPPRWSDAERLLRQTRALPQFAKDVDFMQQESAMWAARGNAQKALEAMQQALQAAPSNPNIIRNYLTVLLQTRNYKQVLAETDQLMKAEGGKQWWVYEIRGQARARGGDKPGAMGELMTALNMAAEAKNDELSLQLVRVIANEVGADEALKVVLPKTKEMRWKLTAALIYHTRGDSENALKLADEAMTEVVALSPAEKASVLRAAGSIYITAKPNPRVSQAAETYKKLLELTPEDMNALNNLAYLYSELSVPPQPKVALEYSTRAIGLLTAANRFDSLVYDTHGWVLVQSGQIGEGIEILRQVLSRQPIPEAHYHLAEAYLKQGYPEEAQRHLSAVTDLLKANEEKKQPVDPTLRAKIDDALLRVTRQIETKKQAGM